MFRDEARKVLGFPPRVADILPPASGLIVSFMILSPTLSTVLLPFQLPTHYHRSNWSRGLKVNNIVTVPTEGYAVVAKADGSTLTPMVPLDQLASFLNHHVDGAVEHVAFDAEVGYEALLPRLLADVQPQKFNFKHVVLDDFFLQLPLAHYQATLQQ